MSSRSILAVAALVVIVPLAALVSSQLSAQSELSELPVPQGWSDAQKQTWYTSSQGSRLIPWDWLQALEQADSAELFLAPQNIRKFRYLPGPPSGTSPALPVGFALDTQSDAALGVTKLRWRKDQGDRAAWVGMNCAACHTGELTFKSLRLRIEGAPAMSDFLGFVNALNRALEATRADAAKWDRFSSRVLGTAADADNQARLLQEFDKLQAWQARAEKVNKPSLEYGPARVDAFGHIYNKVLLSAGSGNQPFNPSDAPVSYPFLWNIHQQDKVQWNGAAPNVPLGPDLDIGALARNVGEVTGVFADVTVQPAVLGVPPLRGYTSSADVRNLLTLEQQIMQLKPPNWPAEFGVVDAEKWSIGQKLFKQRCAECHLDNLPRDDITRRFNVTMTPLSGPKAIGTDPWMACNAFTYGGNTDKLQGTSRKFFIPSLSFFGEKAPVSDMLGTLVIGSIVNRGTGVIDNLQSKLLRVRPFDLKQVPADVLGLPDVALDLVLTQVLDRDAKAKALGADKAARLNICMSKNSPLLAYKARPLVGIWATAPYLHNGSVPTLYDLLLPPAQRPVRFTLGTQEFDPRLVGYAYENSKEYLTERAKAENTFTFKVLGDDGRPIAGNSNLGHDYGNASFSADDRMALVEYMKAANARRVGNKIVR